MTFLLTPCPRSPPFLQPNAHPLDCTSYGHFQNYGGYIHKIRKDR